MTGLSSCRIPRIIRGGAVLAAAVFSTCTPPVEPPDDRPVIIAEGPGIARQLVFALKILRTVHDVGEVTDRFAFDAVRPDSPRIDVAFWNPGAGVPEALSASLRKRSVETAGGVFAGLAAALAVADGRAGYLASVNRDSLMADSIDMGDSVLLSVYAVDTGALDSLWESGTDSLFWKPSNDSRLHLRMVRTRLLRLADTTVTDRIVWKGAALEFDSRLQERAVTGATVYRHRMVWANRQVTDSVLSAGRPRPVSYVIERRDDYLRCFNSADSSQLLAYRDSTAGEDTVTVRRVYDADADSDGVVFRFTDADTQAVRIETTRAYNSNRTIERRSAVEKLTAAGPAILQSYSAGIVRSLRDSVTFRLHDISYEDGRCSLLVVVDPLVPGPADSTVFGLRRNSTYRHLVSFDETWVSPRLLSLSRRDSIAGNDTIAYVEWIAPDADTCGGLMVRVVYGAGQTAVREWTRATCDSDSGYTYLRIGALGDSLKLAFGRSASMLTYRYLKPAVPVRRGTVSDRRDTADIADTLEIGGGSAARRIARGAVCGTRSGSLHVEAFTDTFDIVFVNDTTVRVSGAPGTVYWTVSGGRWQAEYADPESGVDYSWNLTMDPAGIIGGAMAATADGIDVSCAGVGLNAAGHGSMTLYGLVGGGGSDGVATWLKVYLWDENNLNDSYWFH